MSSDTANSHYIALLSLYNHRGQAKEDWVEVAEVIEEPCIDEHTLPVTIGL